MEKNRCSPMFSFNSKSVMIGALLLICYLYYQYNKGSPQSDDSSFPLQSREIEPMYSITIPSTKKYKDFSLIEKFLYNLEKNKLSSAERARIEQ